MVQVGLIMLALVGVVGCQAARQPVALPEVAETRWLLIRNPSFGDVRSEPKYVWVEEDKIPVTKSVIVATPETAATYGPPPLGGKISPRQMQIRIPIVHPRTGEVLGVLEPQR